MRVPDFKVEVEERSENGSVFFWLKHDYVRRAFNGLPADGSYATKAEADAARAAFVAIVESTLD